MVASRRRCALCFGLKGDLAIKRGQIAHINRDSSDSSTTNLCFLCFDHHNEYDSTSRQSKGFLPSELQHYRKNLLQFVKHQPELMWTDAPRGHSENSVQPRSSDYAIVRFYSRRIRIYRAAMALIGAIMRSSHATPEELWAFVRATDEAMFLFDDEVSEYLFELYKKGIYLEYLGKKIESAHDKERYALTSEEMEIRVWFGEQFAVLRDKLASFLRA